MVAAYLIWKYGLSVSQAMAVVKEARPAARFGRGAGGVLQRDLELWENQCRRDQGRKVSKRSNSK